MFNTSHPSQFFRMSFPDSTGYCVVVTSLAGNVKLSTICRSLIILLSLIATGGCTSFDILNSVIPSCGYIRTSNLPYADLPRQKLDVYVPRHAKSKTPVVVFFYGGDWQNG